MRPVRIAALLAVGMLATLALTAGSAFAQHEVEVTDEGSGTHCGIVPCDVHVVSTGPTFIVAHWFIGVETVYEETACDQEFDLTIDTAAGTGSIHNQVFAGGECQFKPCGATSQSSGDGDPWPIALHESEQGAEFGLDLELCIAPVFGGDDHPCHVELLVDPVATHDYELTAGPDVNGPQCTNLPPYQGISRVEYSGHWLTEDTNIEIEHFD